MTGRRTSPGFGEWLIVAFTVGLLIFLLFKLYEFAQVRLMFPTGLTVAGVDIGGLSEEDARNRLSQFYLNTPITLLHGDQPIEINPSRAEFQLNLDKLMVDAIAERDNQPFWGGYWGYLWNRPVAVQAIPLEDNPESPDFNVSHNEEALRRTLGLVANQFDQVAEQSRSSGSEMDFLPGATGQVTDIEASLPDVANALYRPYERQARLVLTGEIERR